MDRNVEMFLNVEKNLVQVGSSSSSSCIDSPLAYARLKQTFSQGEELFIWLF